MQHIRTPGAAVSHLFKMLDLMAVIRFQVGISPGLAMLLGRSCMSVYFQPSERQRDVLSTEDLR